jgi:hypothetical protein
MKCRTCAATLACLLLVSCSEKGHPPTYPVLGTVTFEGKPVANADVMLAPRDANGKPARGKTDAEGKFTVRTYFGPNDDPEGAYAGEYTVTVVKFDLPAGGVDPYKQKMPSNQLPSRYSDPGKSTATATVSGDGPNEITVTLTK